MAHAGGVIEHDPLRHTAQPLEQVARRQARALSVPARHRPHQTDVRIRETRHEMMHPLHHATQQHVDLAEIGLHLARTPYQVHERLVAPGREPAPGLRHRPRHRGQGDLRAMPVPRPLPDPGRGMPLLAPVRTILREPLLRPRANTGPTANARVLPADGTADRSSLARHLRTVGTAGMRLPRDRRDGLPVPPQTTDRPYLGHAGHNPSRSFLAEIQAPSGQDHDAVGMLCLNPKNLRDQTRNN